MDKEPMTPERAEAITALGAALSELAVNNDATGISDKCLALALALRAVVAVAASQLCGDNPGIDRDKVREHLEQLALDDVARVFTMPDEVVQAVEGNNASGRVKVETMPAGKKH